MSISERLASLPGEKRALLEARLHRSASIARRDHGGAAPLSYAQERLWFLEHLDPGTTRYNGVQAFRIRGGPLDVAALSAALDAIAARHETVRTSFPTIGGVPQARIAERGSFPLEIVELADVPPVERDERARAIARDELLRPLHLERGPLARARVARFAVDDCVLMFTFHHILTDRWSGAIFARELSHFYARAAADLSPDDLPTLAVQYADVAAWERERVAGGELGEALAYWRERLAELPAPLTLPSDHIDAGTQARGGATFRAPLSGDLGARLQVFCQQERVTPFMVVLAAFDALLQRYTARDDIAIGTVVAGRTQPETEQIIGFFVNTLVMRADLSGDPSFRELVARVRGCALDAFEHQEVPFEKIVEALRPQRERDATPFFRVMFAVQNAPPRSLDLSPLSVEELDIDPGEAKFDLTVMIEQTADGLACVYEYATGLFDCDAIARLSGHYATLLAAALENPETPLSALPLLDAAEREQVVVAWNATARPFPADEPVDVLFERQARRTPNAPAVLFEGRSITYAELDERASRLARILRADGVDRDVAVGVYLETGFEQIVAILAVLKAGGGYLPLDPTNPIERTALMLEDAGARVVLTSGLLAVRLAESSCTRTLCIERECTDNSDDALPPERGARSSDDLLCVIYTSGSTGRPKGVEITHRCVTRLVCDTDYVSFGPDDVVPQSGNFAFDISTFEIWGPLLHGGRVLLFSKDVLLEPATYARTLRDEHVTIAFLTPVVFAQIARTEPTAFAPLRCLIVGGEALDPSAARSVLESGAPPRQLLNGYGPTEVTTFSTTHVVHDVPPGARSIPIGRPIANTTAYILDRRLEPVPIGVPGELFLGGPGVARGYRGRPELTAERFIADPFSSDPRARLYRTGDIVRRLADGTIDFLGRNDDQVKIRGFRIELGEIEATLGAHPAVAASTVLFRRRDGDSSHGELVAYVVPRDGDGVPPLDIEALRRHVARTLPSHMAPAAYVVLSAFPTNANGKVDRAALPPPPRDAGAASIEAVQSPLQLQLLAIWEELLERHPIDLDDDFFAIGGHSLLAVRMLHRVESATGTRLPVRTLFERPTVRALADAIEQCDPRAAAPPYVALREQGSRPPFFLFHGYLDGGLYTIELARSLEPDRPFYALHPHDTAGGAQLPPTIEAMALDHIRVIRAIAPHGPYYLGGFCNGARVAFEVALRLQLEGEDVALLAILTTPPPNRSLHLRKAIAKFASLRRLDRYGELDVYVRWKERLALIRSPRSLVHRLTDRLPAQATKVAAKPVDDAAAGLDIRDERWYAYVDRLSWYVPRSRFDGRIALIFGKDARRASGDPTMGWRHFARQVDVYAVPGDALSSLTSHAEDVGRALCSAFSRIDA